MHHTRRAPFSTLLEKLSCSVAFVTQVSVVMYKLGLTQEFVVDCAHAPWVVHTTKRLVFLMLLKGFLSDSFIYFMYRRFR